MENKKGNGVFLGVVAVATLIVAIIGATFAYFSITAQSAENAVNLSAYDTAATLEVTEIAPDDAEHGLIPLDPDALVGNTGKGNLAYAINEAGSDALDAYGKCVDSRGYQICALYQLDFYNSSANSMIFTGTIKTTLNNAATEEVPVENGEPGETTTQTKSNRSAFLVGDLKVRTGIIGYTDGPITFDATGSLPNTYTIGATTGGSAATEGDPIAVGSEVGIGTVEVSAYNGNPNTPETTKYVVVYLDGSGDATNNGTDQSSRMGASFQGQLIFQSGNDSQLTGTFNVTGG